MRGRAVDAIKLCPFLVSLQISRIDVRGEKMQKRLIFLSAVMALAGCVQQLKPGMIRTYSQPLMQAEKDPNVNFGKYRTFTVRPTAELDSRSKMNPIIEKQLLFALRSRFELLGYQYVDDIKQADLYLQLYYSNEYKSTYVPPTITTVPWYVPGQTQTTHIDLYGSTGSHWGTATTTTPGYYIPMTHTTPGYYVGAYYPCISIGVFDKNTNKAIWSGRAIVSTPQNSALLSSQCLITNLLEGNLGFPFCADPYKRGEDLKTGVFGCGFIIYALEGNDFYPVIRGVWDDSPIDQAGLKPYDIVIKVDSQSTRNLPHSKIRAMFDKNAGENLMLTVLRGNRFVEAAIVAENEVTAQSKWQQCTILGPKGGIKTITLKAALQSLTAIGIDIDKAKLFDLIP